MVGIKRFKLIIGIIIPFFAIILMSHNASAATASVSSAYVDFWSSSSQTGQVQANVSLPWGANIGGSASDRQSFYLNNISMTYPITAAASDLSVFGRLVMRFQPAFTSGEDAYFCNVHLNDISTSLTDIQTSCSATITYNFSDNSTYSSVLPIYFNFTLPSGDLAAYVDYTQSLPNVSLSSITATFAKTGNYDIYSVTNGYSLVLTTLVSDASYYITDSGGNVDISPLVNQNQTIINQNQQIINNQNQNTQDIINNQNQNTQDIIKSNQNCIKNLFLGDYAQFNNSGGTGVLYSYFKLPNSGDYTLSITAKNNVTVPSPIKYIGFTANGGNAAGSVVWLYGGAAMQEGQTRSIQNFYNGNHLPFLSIYPNNEVTFNWFMNNFNIQLEEGTDASSFISYGQEVCKNFNEEYYDEQRQADQNISNQTTGDIQGAENQTTTNLIGVLSGFVSAFSNINATNCSLTLEFPNYAGGSRIVDICQGKEKAPRIIEIGSSLFLIGVFVPLAYILIKMIYNEIRSWTNG